MDLKNEIIDITKQHMILIQRENSINEIIKKRLYSDDEFSPEVTFGLTCSYGEDSYYLEIGIEYNDADCMSDEIIQKIIDSINEIFGELDNFNQMTMCEYKHILRGNGHFNIELKYNEN